MLLIDRVSHTYIQNTSICIGDCIKISFDYFCFQKQKNILYTSKEKNYLDVNLPEGVCALPWDNVFWIRNVSLTPKPWDLAGTDWEKKFFTEGMWYKYECSKTTSTFRSPLPNEVWLLTQLHREHWRHLIIVNKTAVQYYKQFFIFSDQKVQYIIKNKNNIE